jgi:hypothetical protein
VLWLRSEKVCELWRKVLGNRSTHEDPYCKVTSDLVRPYETLSCNAYLRTMCHTQDPVRPCQALQGLIINIRQYEDIVRPCGAPYSLVSPYTDLEDPISPHLARPRKDRVKPCKPVRPYKTLKGNVRPCKSYNGAHGTIIDGR